MKIVVLCGGISTERDVSIISGTEVCKALRMRGHRAVLLDVFCGTETDPTLGEAAARDDLGSVFPEEYDVAAAAAAIRAMNPRLPAMIAEKDRPFFGPDVLKLCRLCDVVFCALHGQNGENGKVQAALDLCQVKYTGTGSVGSAIAMDKGLSKILLNAAHVPTPHGVTIRKKSHFRDLAAYTMKFPVVDKPASGGSSVGVFIVYDQETYEKALRDAFEIEDELIVEDYVKGREFSVSVIDGKALPVIEIAPVTGFYDYKNKYTPGGAIETCPANIPHRLSEQMQRYAETGYAALRLEGYGRLDFMMNENGDLYCLEANTLPGMTPTSLMPQEAAQAGMDFPTLCEELIRVSLRKYSEGT